MTFSKGRGRMLAGRVVDALGRGVAGARVTTGFIAVVDDNGTVDGPHMRRRQAVTDANGGFAISIWTEGALQVAGADHPTLGRSLPIEIPPGMTDPPPITITLLECGALAGTVTRNGEPIGGAILGAGWPEFGYAQASNDGAFVMARLPAGPVALRIYVPTDRGRAHQVAVQVVAGTRTQVTIDLPVGTVELSVLVTSRAEVDLGSARLSLFRGTVAFASYKELSARLHPEAQGFALWEGNPRRPATFERVEPGDYTICVVPVHPGDRVSGRVYCVPARLAATPEHQTLTVELP